MAEDEGTLTGHVKALARAATNTYLATSRRLAKDTLFSTLEDFTRASISQKRLVVVGCTGSGKSTLLNVLSGWRFVQSVKPPFDFCWLPKETPPSDSTDAAAETETASDEGAAAGEGSSAAAGDSPPAPPKPLFESGAAADSVTKCASFANIEWRGDPNRLLTVVDTPGHDDPSGSDLDSKECREALGALAADLHNKLKALGHVHAILVLHNDVASNRLNPATYQLLKMVDEKFLSSGERSVWQHVILGYSKCNTHDLSWRSRLDEKRAVLQQAIKEKIPGCEVEVPVVALGGGTIDPPPPSSDEVDGLEVLWDFVQAAQPLDTSNLQPFEGADVKWQKIVDARDLAEARAKAALIYTLVIFKVACLLSLLFWRHALLPRWVGLLLLNFEGIYDELLILGAFVHWVGPKDVYYSACHFYRVWLEAHLDPYVQAYLAPYFPSLAKPTDKHGKPKDKAE